MRPTTILISDDPAEQLVAVEVLPPPGGIGHDRQFRHRFAARRYADRLGVAMRWPVVDLADQGAGR